jgi:predicted RNA polymerase sigma factor
VPTDVRFEDLLRTLAPQVLGAVVRRYEHFDAAEDAVQEALLAAAVQAGLELVAALDVDGRLAGQHRLDAVRAHLLEIPGDTVPQPMPTERRPGSLPVSPNAATSMSRRPA